jgi:ATP-binding cassette subfamily C protein
MTLITTKEFKPKPTTLLSSDILIKNISYSYPNTSINVLSNISMQINKGSVVGIIGQSGSGKSTLIDVILGLLKPTEGQILVDGVDIATNVSGWQSQIGYVPQSIYLTDESIRSNIAFGLPEDEIDDKKIRKAILSAQLDVFIDSLADGLDTAVGERGVRLSGGQRQRIGIARALYNDPRVLVLDEATSALDSLMAQEVMKAVDKMRGERTILMVAHQITTIKDCDHIYILENGSLVDSGSYEELHYTGLDDAVVKVSR